MEEQKNDYSVVLPVVVDTLPGRNMRTCYVDDRIYNEPKSNKRPHLLSSVHMDEMEELPF